MNLMERKNDHSKGQDWREDIRSDKMQELQEDDLLMEDLDIDDNEETEETAVGLQGLLQRPYMTTVLLGVIVALLICIIMLLVLMPGRKTVSEGNGDLQQNITDYVQEQKLNDSVKNVSGDAVVVKLPEENEEKPPVGTVSGQEQQSGTKK